MIKRHFIPGPDQAAEHQTERVRLPVRVRRDEHHQASPPVKVFEYIVSISVCICIDEVDVGKITKTTRLNPTRLIGSVFQD